VLIYSDRRYLAENCRHVPMLIPFWGPHPGDGDPSASDRFDRYAVLGPQYFRMVPLAEADIAVLPGEWQFEQANPLGEALASEASVRGKPLVVFYGGDPTGGIPLANSVVFRNSFYRSERRPNEFALPGFCQDLVSACCGGELRPRPYRRRPVVSFCGHALGFKESVRHALLTRLPRAAVQHLLGWGMQPSVAPGRVLRRRAMQALARSREVRTNFVVRRLFWNGVFRSDGSMDVALARRSRREFVDNLLDSDYALCVRGFGNYSYRLYEALSLGRIPVLIDTDCVLPYDRWIDWKKYVVWVDQSEVQNVAKHVASFHASLTPAAFEDLQKACRQLWDEWLSPHGFFANFHRHFESCPGGRSASPEGGSDRSEDAAR
jgi:hypothetical protein